MPLINCFSLSEALATQKFDSQVLFTKKLKKISLVTFIWGNRMIKTDAEIALSEKGEAARQQVKVIENFTKCFR